MWTVVIADVSGNADQYSAVKGAEDAITEYIVESVAGRDVEKDVNESLFVSAFCPRHDSV